VGATAACDVTVATSLIVTASVSQAEGRPASALFPVAGTFSGWLGALAAALGVPVALGCAALFSVRLPTATAALLTVGAFACVLGAQRRLQVAFAVGLAALFSRNPVFGIYESALVALLFGLRRRPLTFLLAAAVFCLVVPKTLFLRHYHEPGYYNWLSEPHLALIFFVSLFHWRQSRDGRLPRLAAADEPYAWGLLFWFPGHVANPMVFGARELWAAPGFDAKESTRALGRLALKSGVMWLWLRGEATLSFAHLTPATSAALGGLAAWRLAGWNYGATLLQLSGTAELAIVLAQLFGFRLPPAFRWAFLAPNPVELWRRWGIYNRKILLALVYFPLGGKNGHPIRNVLLTFLASAWLLHSGWFGSKYCSVGVGGWRDEALYFLLQGCAVSLVLMTRRRGDTPTRAGARRWLALGLGVVATQAFSAWAHMIILPQALPLALRFRLMLTCLGLG